MSNGLYERFKRYPKAVLAAYLAQLAESGQTVNEVSADLAVLARHHDELRRSVAERSSRGAANRPGAVYALGDEAPECGVGKDDERPILFREIPLADLTNAYRGVLKRRPAKSSEAS